MTLPRTYLYVPGNSPDKLEGALGRGADAVIADLEDAVPMAEKDTALDTVLGWLQAHATDGPELWVRLNSGERRLHEVARLRESPGLAGLVLAKTADAAEVAAVASISGELELMPMVESPGAVLDARALAAGPRVRQLQIGEVDLAGETRLQVGEDEAELAPHRALVVLGSAAAGIAPPPGPVSREIRDLDRFAVSTRRLIRQGFHGRVCIHPAQVAVVHELMVPTPAQIAEAQETLVLLDEAEARGTGVIVDSAGRLVDPAVLHSARAVLALARQSGVA